jgi:AcrR family transcriptional regulator
MSPPPPQHQVSRRERPAKLPLNRAAIVSAAVQLLRADGLERVTMRRLATTLDTGPASLYVYFRSTAHLHAALLDELLGEVDLVPTNPDTAWQERLVGILASYAGVLFAYPSVAKLSVSARPSGPNGLQMLEAILALLDEGGIAPGAAAWGSDQLVQYATATATEHGARDEQAALVDGESDLARALASLSPDSHPHLHALRDTMVAGEEGARFRWGIDVLLAGLEDRRNSDPPGAYLTV